MINILSETKSQLREIILNAMGKAISLELLPEEPMPDFTIEIPADNNNGDFATNVAMIGARVFKQAPIKIANIIKDNIDLSGSMFKKVCVAGPGFINFFLSDAFYSKTLLAVEEVGENYGKSNFGQGKKVNVEFVSANPTGPMHMGNARGGALGDCLAAVLDAAGFDVCREFYINDAGNQIERFGLSLDIRYRQLFCGNKELELPEDCYKGEDIIELAKEYADKYGDSLLKLSDKERRKVLVEFALPKNIKRMQNDMEKYRINYDVWFKESVLHSNGELDETINILKQKGLTYEKDGALWYKATEFGSEKDEVLIRQNKTPTYFAVDIAYHRNKLKIRGFDKCINIWGADHHGHVARLKGAINAVGLDGSKLDVVLMQLVHLVKDGEVVKMSKRTGKAIVLSDLLDEVPIDSARFFFNLREANSQMDFDLDLAVKQDALNPVYYVQYAHARIKSIERKLSEEGIKKRKCTLAELNLLNTAEERDLMRHISSFTDEIICAAKAYDPARITRYVINLANLFHRFYNSHKVKGEDEKLTQARLTLCLATATVIKNILVMFKIEAPEVM